MAVTVSNSKKAELAKNLGANIVINYNEIPLSQWMETVPNKVGYDVVFNTPGAPSINGAVAAAKFWGTIVDILGDFPTKPGFQGKWLTFNSLFAGHEIVAGTNPSYVGKILTEIGKLTEIGQLKPVIAQNRFKFTEVGIAHDYAEAESPTGKVVLVQDLSYSSKFSEGR